MRRSGFLLLIAALALACVLTACAKRQLAPAVVKDLGSQAATVVAKSGVTVAATRAVNPVATQASEKADEVAFADVKDLGNLKSYRLTNTWSWQNDKGEKSSLDSAVEFVREPLAKRTITKSSRNGKDERPVETIRIGDDNYTGVEGQWLATKVSGQEPAADPLASPDTYFGKDKGTFVGLETVNGMATRHYRYDARPVNPVLGVSEVQEYRADVWVSIEFKVYVKTTVHLVAVDPNKAKVTYDIASSLSDINKPIVIRAPEGVAEPGLPEDVPIMEGATNLVVSGGQVATFKVPRPLADVTKYYEDAMRARGWTAKDSPARGMLAFSKGDRGAQVLLNAEGSSTGVSIILAPGTGTTPPATRAVAPTATRPAAVTPAQPRATESMVTAPTPEPTARLGPPSDVPLMDGATDVEKAEGGASFTVAKSLVDVVEFYKGKLGAAGWKLEDENEDGSYLLFKKDSRTVNVNSVEQDGQTQVMVFGDYPD